MLDATIMYADMNGSTAMVDNLTPTRAAEVYKVYLSCAARIIKADGGVITAYDGDRIMAVFIGKSKNTSAARAALKINWAVENIVNPGLKKQYGADTFQMGHVIGIDTSNILVSRIGVRNDNDLVWVGRAANYAAKLSAINDNFNIWITDDVFTMLHDSSKYSVNPPAQLMWEARLWTPMSNMRIHGSKNWVWPV
jgi:class 3 adenylate cyclase